MTLNEMRQILSEEGIQLTKALGQNFLHDAGQLRHIVEMGALSRADRVLEIGPGLGPLTELLVGQAGEVMAIEMDARLVTWLEQRFRVKAEVARWKRGAPAPLAAEGLPPDGPPVVCGAGEPGAAASGGRGRLHLIHDDALAYLRRAERDWNGWKVVANLPYSVASPILVELAAGRQRPELMAVTLQLEVARRLMSKAGDDDYGVLSLLVQLAYEPAGWFKIPAGCFYPPPKIDSACLCLKRRVVPLLPEELTPVFRRVVKAGFSQRRKKMSKMLRAGWPVEAIGQAMAELGLAEDIRAERVSLEQHVALTQKLSGFSPGAA